MKLYCYLQSRHASVSPVKAGGKETSLAVQWLQLRLPKQGVWARSLIRELRSHMPHSQKKQSIKQKRYCSKFSKDFKKGLHQKIISFLKKSRRYKVALKWYHFADHRVASLESSQRGRKPGEWVLGWRQEVGSHGWTSMWTPSLEEPGTCTFCFFFGTHDCGAWVLGGKTALGMGGSPPSHAEANHNERKEQGSQVKLRSQRDYIRYGARSLCPDCLAVSIFIWNHDLSISVPLWREEKSNF